MLKARVSQMRFAMRNAYTVEYFSMKMGKNSKMCF